MQKFSMLLLLPLLFGLGSTMPLSSSAHCHTAGKEKSVYFPIFQCNQKKKYSMTWFFYDHCETYKCVWKFSFCFFFLEIYHTQGFLAHKLGMQCLDIVTYDNFASEGVTALVPMQNIVSLFVLLFFSSINWSHDDNAFGSIVEGGQWDCQVSI